METVTSVRNPALKAIRKSIANGSLTDEGFCVAEGFHLLDEAIRSGCRIEAVFANSAAAASIEGRLGAGSRIQISVLPDKVFRSIVSTDTPQGVVALVKPPVWRMDDLFRLPALVLVLDGIQDPGNAGAMIRAAEAFGATGIALLKGSVYPYNPKALRASAGSVFRVPLRTDVERTELFEVLDHSGAALFALMPSASSAIQECHLDRPCAIVVGNEGRGVSKPMQDRAKGIRIPTLGVESLNAAMAATVVLYEARKQRTSVPP